MANPSLALVKKVFVPTNIFLCHFHNDTPGQKHFRKKLCIKIPLLTQVQGKSLAHTLRIYYLLSASVPARGRAPLL